jgi:hypothetical protein
MVGKAAAPAAQPSCFKKLRRPINVFLFIVSLHGCLQFAAAKQRHGGHCPGEGGFPHWKNQQVIGHNLLAKFGNRFALYPPALCRQEKINCAGKTM